MQIIGEPIGADEVKVLTGQKRRLSLIECNQEFFSRQECRKCKVLAFCIFLSVNAGLGIICS